MSITTSLKVGGKKCITETPVGSSQRRYKDVWLMKFLEEDVNVFADFIRLFLLQKMGNSFQHNYFFQKRHIFLEPAFVDEVLST
ncbi:unnamed protein product [Malus baccata var. baccata]